jgi:RNA polymerase sigma factor (TIGR02999 family)
MSDPEKTRDSDAADLLPVVYAELRRLAHHYMRGERAGHTLQTTALINEVYLRLAGLDELRWRDRTHFFAMAATLMRRVLVDYARQRGRAKRGAGISLTSPDENAAAPQPEVTSLRSTKRCNAWRPSILSRAGSSSSGSLPGCRSSRRPKRSASRRRR